MPNNNKKKKIKSLYLGGFILAVSEAIIAYVQSSYLNQFYNLEIVSWIFIITYIVTFFIINKYPNFIARFTNLKTAAFSLLLKVISLLIFICFPNPISVFIGFILFTVSFTLAFINFDIFLETFTSDEKTGRIRGIYFSIYNFGWLASPFLSGIIVDYSGFNTLFIIDIALALIVLVLLLWNFRALPNHYAEKHFEIISTFKEILRRKNIKKIFEVSFILHFFYAVMIIYTPIYLNQYIGLSWSEIGLVFTVMLIPFILLQYPAGYLADKYYGEKEILTTGLIIMALASFIIFYFHSYDLLAWAVILFFSRIGASLVEIMRETYFFKKVDAKDIQLINALRSITPISYIIAPLAVGLILSFLQIEYVFLFLGLIILLGLYPALTLKDTK
ncbi:MAG: hypothetical protein A2Y82_04765 [Candidatus Buchananbacteria bacterium RBG_13_36_9]|uniref:Major facilitator superfamily (MFS) profile domain-containing protein n=1 Tax=Candidatus Buchananbacteria bacterium RBG_13_36_9 TaxID=1797530 RepID=A0A1G1XQQ3_9BACT|nr:MAG: hypothetical protein A2Y82_04765 [Candidatus Buchananbacteria bacterium RBG_13_36_9]